ncbi:MAG: HAD family hydrolase [Candidatus Helarchaeota archaeon]
MTGNSSTVFFDLDGVLVSNKFFTTYYLDKVLEKLREINIIMDRNEILQKIFNLFNMMLISDDKNERVKAFDWDELVRILFNKYKLEWPDNIKEFYESPLLKDYVFLYSDAKNILEWLASKGYPMALISNGLAKYQTKVLEILNIDTYFENIILPDHVNEIKPSPEIFKYALSKCLKNPDEKNTDCIYVGDSLYFDVYGANLCGLKSILLVRSLNIKFKKLSIDERTLKFNENKYFFKFMKKDLILGRFNLDKINVNLLRPDKVICSLNELKEIL